LIQLLARDGRPLHTISTETARSGDGGTFAPHPGAAVAVARRLAAGLQLRRELLPDRLDAVGTRKVADAPQDLNSIGGPLQRDGSTVTGPGTGITATLNPEAWDVPAGTRTPCGVLRSELG
jgi:hypothetical protein